MAVYKFIEKKGYTGKYSIVADFVKHYREQEIKHYKSFNPSKDLFLTRNILFVYKIIIHNPFFKFEIIFFHKKRPPPKLDFGSNF